MACSINRYGLKFPALTTEAQIEVHMIRHGGQWLGKRGQVIGNGLFWHYKRLETVIWGGEKIWHRWNELQLEQYLQNRIVGILGPASSGKTNGAATDLLADYYVYPECTTILICSTTKERLEDRIWGEMKKYHRIAKSRFPELPGNLIEGRLRIVTDNRDEASEGRDMRNGVVGVPCKRGGDYVGLGDFIGIKNKRVRMAADELQLLPPAFIMSISNLDKNPDLKVLGMGNPKETTDALGTLCEPAYELGGWDSNIDQAPTTKTWKTRSGGVCIQFVGSDSPNLDGKLGIPLISQAAIDRDVERYGKDSLQFTMMNQGMMPRGQGSRRVLTRQLCLKNGAMNQPEWLSSERTRVGFLDAAYRGVGGDRCIFGELQFGYESKTLNPAELDVSNLISQKPSRSSHNQILNLVDLLLVPVNVNTSEEPEDQIASFVHQLCSTRGIPPQNFFFDAGMRTSLVSAFARMWSPLVNPIDCGGSPSDKMVSDKIQVPANKHYSKRITEMWFRVRLIVESGQFRGMKESALQEFCQREWTMVGNNKIEVESKKDFKEKLGKSPDLADAVAIGCEGASRLGFIINTIVNRDHDAQDHRWKTKFITKARERWSEKSLTYK